MGTSRLQPNPLAQARVRRMGARLPSMPVSATITGARSTVYYSLPLVDIGHTTMSDGFMLFSLHQIYRIRSNSTTPPLRSLSLTLLQSTLQT